MGLIRISDSAEEKIKELSEGRTITATVDWLVGRNDVSGRLDKMAAYLEKKLEQVKKDIIASIENTAIDRIDVSRTKRGDRALDFQKEVWPLFYEKLDENNPAWFPGAYAAAHESSDMAEATYFVDYNKNVLYSMFYDVRAVWLHLTPEVLSFLDGEKNELS